jgi:hypothetical protein
MNSGTAYMERYEVLCHYHIADMDCEFYNRQWNEMGILTEKD